MIPKKSLAVAAAALFAAMSLVSQAAHAGPRLDKIICLLYTSDAADE